MSTFPLTIVTPDGLLFEGEAERLRVRTIEGDVCILARHIDYATALGMGEAAVTIDGKVRRAACMGGLLSVTGGRVSLVPTTFEWADQLDAPRAQRAKERAETLLANRAKMNDREFRLAEARLKRALVRLHVGQ